MNMNNEQKLEQMIEVAKQVLKENPNDTWVAKGLVAMEEELGRLRNTKQKR
jgi:cytochrome c-type biogenesis protein CcmH/NrfG